MKKIAGYSLLLISTLAWGIILIIPFLDIEAKDVATYITVLIIIGEVTFFTAIALLGKEIWQKIKTFFIIFGSKPKNTDESV